MTTASSREYLESLLMGSFGQTTFSIRKLGCEDLFDSLNGRILYFYRRLQVPNGQAINEEACSRFLALSDRALSGNLKTIDPVVFSSDLARTLSRFNGLKPNELEFHYSDETSTKKLKKDCLLEMLRSTMQLFVGRDHVSTELISKTARASYELARSQINRVRKDMPYGIQSFYFNVTEVNYPEKLHLVQKNLDIVHFHGLSWTNQNREFLLDALKKETLSVRVSLLNPDSPFFVPYAEFIDVDPIYLREKTNEVVRIWNTLVKDACSSGKTMAKFKLVYNKGFPAKAIYRFDDTIVVTPTTNARPKAQFMAYECVRSRRDEKDAYRIYLSEIEWLMKTGETVSKPGTPPLSPKINQRSAIAFICSLRQRHSLDITMLTSNSIAMRYACIRR